MIALHNKDFTTKYGTINTTIEAFVEEERNGLFELSFVMLNTDSLFNYVKEDNIVVANANDTLLNQKFRIYMTRKLMNNRVEVFARHISFDLMYDYIDSVKFENQSCEYALNMLFRNSSFSSHYKGYSNIINAQDYNMSMANILEAIGGKEGSILDTYGTGAELLRDNENIHVLNKRGHDNSVAIEYKKNLTGFELEEDTTELITRILPYAKYTPQDEEGNSQDEVIVKASFVDSSLIANYSHPFIRAIDYSDKFDDKNIPTTDKLKALAELEYKNNKVDIPKQNFKIEFIPLSKCVGYEGLSDNINLCDTVTIKDTRYNINTQAKVIKVTYNVLKNRYESMELGEPKTSLGDIVGGNSGEASKGEQGPQGPQGPPGADGDIGDFPDSLPAKSILTGKSVGLASIELTWTFENKVYYSYELYASKTKDFKPNNFDLIYEGQASAFLFQAKPNETWYFRVCAINSHGNRNEFSDQISVSTAKINGNDWIENATIGNALIGDLSADKITSGTISGHYIDARNLSVTDGNGKRTLDIDSFGNVNLNVSSLKISSSNVATEDTVTNNLNNLQIGGRNLLKSSDKIYLTGSDYPSVINREQGKVTVLGTGRFNNYAWVHENLSTPLNTLTPEIGKKFTMSVDVRTTNLKENNRVGVEFEFWGSGTEATTGIVYLDKDKNGIWHRVSATITTLDVNYSQCLFNITSVGGYSDFTGLVVEYKNWKLEEGNKPTDWTPAPEDVQSQIDTNKTNISTTTNKVATIETNLNNITSKVSSVETTTTTINNKVTSQETRLSSAEQKITADAIVSTVTSSTTYRDDLSGKVDTNKVVSSINQTAESIKINANKIQLEGATTVGNGESYILINDYDYRAYVNGRLAINVGGYNDGGSFIPSIYMGANGFNSNSSSSNGQYFVMKNYGSYHHLAQRHTDGVWSIISFDSSGDITLDAKRDINFENDVYANKPIHMYGSTLDLRGSDGIIGARLSNTSLVVNQISNMSGGTIHIQGNLRSMYSSQTLGTSDGRWSILYCVSSPNVSSDIRLKENIRYINNVNKVNIEEIEQEEVTQLDTYNFVKDDLNIAEYKYLEQDNNTFGFIAQDVENTKVGSKFIHKDNEGYLSYDSGAYVNILAGALKEAINKIEKLENEIKTLKANN